MRWAQPDVNRDQLVLFAEKLDDAVEQDHIVRMIDQLLDRVDWRPLEDTYHPTLGQPPIHPRVLCAVILYGLICRIRASRKLEEALTLRIDFRWLAQGMSIDHSTLSEFRRKHPEQLRDLFVQIVLIGQQMELVQFKRMTFDGTRVRANNRKSGTRTPEQLRESKKLQEEFDRLNEKADTEDAHDEELFDSSAKSDGQNNDEQASHERRRRQLEQAQASVDAALAELDKIENSSEKTPSRLPITDPESRFGRNKEGGFAPNYTPTATVDADSGMVVDQGVIAQSNESSELVETIDQVQQDYHLDEPVSEVLADGLMATGENLQACEELGVDLYSPVPGAHAGDNPAIRDDLQQPVAAEQIAALPMKNVTIDGHKTQRFAKQAFVYDAEEDVYRCPAGEALAHSSSYQTTESGRTIQRTRYRAEQATCSACPLAAKCLSGKAKYRQIDRGEHEAVIDRQNAKMQQPASQAIYATRSHVGERPFAVIKQVFGLRQFLTRGLASVRQEWSWATIAFNLQTLARHLSGSTPRTGVPP